MFDRNQDYERRLMVRCVGLLALSSMTPLALADSTPNAMDFVQNRVVEAFQITSGAGSDEAKRKKLNEFLLAYFDSRRFAQVGLGDEYEAFNRNETKNGTLTDESLAKLRDIYDQHVRDEIIDYFLLYLKDMDPSTFTVVGSAQNGPDQYRVKAQMATSGKSSGFVFDVTSAGGTFRAFNVFDPDTDFSKLVGGNEVAVMQSEYGDPAKFLYRLNEIESANAWYQ